MKDNYFKSNEEYQNYLKLQIEGSDWSYNSPWGDQMEDAMINWFAKDVADKNSSIIDIGCGEGRGLDALMRAGYKKIAGVDIAVDKIKKAKEKGHKIYEEDFHDLKLENQKFDYVFCSHTLEHSYDLKKAFESILNICNKKIYFILPIFETEDFVKKHNPSHTSFINDPEYVISILNKINKKYTTEIKNRMSFELWGTIEL